MHGKNLFYFFHEDKEEPIVLHSESRYHAIAPHWPSAYHFFAYQGQAAMMVMSSMPMQPVHVIMEPTQSQVGSSKHASISASLCSRSSFWDVGILWADSSPQYSASGQGNYAPHSDQPRRWDCPSVRDDGETRWTG